MKNLNTEVAQILADINRGFNFISKKSDLSPLALEAKKVKELASLKAKEIGIQLMCIDLNREIKAAEKSGKIFGELEIL